MKTAAPPLPIVSGKGSTLITSSGERFLDGISSWWVNLHGHCHPHIADKIGKQARELEHVLFAGCIHPRAEELSDRILPLFPGNMGKIFYSDNGSTAVEVGLKIAIQYWYNQGIPKTTILSFRNGYHGDTLGMMAAAGKNEFNRPFWNHMFDVVSITPPTKGNEEQSLREIKEALSHHDVACFLFEPLMQGVAGMIPHCPLTLDRLLAECKKQGVLTIADEVMTGFGRTGPLFASEHLANSPDILCVSKGITGGFLPLGATVCTRDVYEHFHANTIQKAFLHGHSYTANPIACASALASLDLLLTDSCEKKRKAIGKAHHTFVKKWQMHPKLIRCETLGTILVLEYRDEAANYFSSIRDSLYTHFIQRNILLRPLGNVLYVLPPYCITGDELTSIYLAIEETLEGSI